GRPAHQFTSTALDQPFTSTAPDTGGGSGTSVERYGYNADRQLTSVARPDGSTVAFTYDGAGRVSRVSAPGGDTTFGYDQASGALTSGVAPSGEHTDLTLDGPLPTSET
ncbi:MAG: hypothetical protein E6G53_02055, partial [Actinobacteria bacterium]